MLAFKRSNNSWHGHEPFAGERRVIQFNWLTSQGNRQIACCAINLAVRRRGDLRVSADFRKILLIKLSAVGDVIAYHPGL